ncbi:MAG TPA: hypothetical protein PK411_11520 [Mesotoga infera]|nr:hypothetical protein [Mesotoga infera]
MLYPSSSSFIRKADRREVSTFSLTATIIVDKSFLRIQVIAYISTTDHRSRSVPIFALSFLSLSLFLSSSRTFERRVHGLGRLTMDGSSEREPMWDDRSGCEWCVVKSNSAKIVGKSEIPRSATAKIGYRPKEQVSPHFRSLFSLTLSLSLLFSLSPRTGPCSGTVDDGRLF